MGTELADKLYKQAEALREVAIPHKRPVLKHGKKQLTIKMEEEKEGADLLLKQIISLGKKSGKPAQEKRIIVKKYKVGTNGSIPGRMKQRRADLKLMKEPKAEKIFLSFYKQIVNLMGDKSTGNKQLDMWGKKLFGDKYLGTFPQDKLPQKLMDKKSYFSIINVDTTGLPGTHWVAVAGLPNSNKIMVYDSFGRATKKLLPVIAKQAKKKIIDTDYDAEQKKIQKSCGQYSLAWLMFFDKHGAKNAKLI